MNDSHTSEASSPLAWADVLGCPITKIQLDDFVALCESFIQSGTPHYVAVVNAAKIVKMRSNQELDLSVRSADLVGADGVPVVWASRLLGDPLPGRVNGTDLMYELLAKSDIQGYRVFFFGATADVLDEVLERAKSSFPGLSVGGYRHGYFSSDDEGEIVAQIRESRSDILFIAFGTPKKEIWVGKYLDAMGVPLVHGVGGSFDVFAGLVPRAPLWMQRAGLEWLFRLVQEPRRMWKRYLVTNSVFLGLLAREVFYRGFRRIAAKTKQR